MALRLAELKAVAKAFNEQILDAEEPIDLTQGKRGLRTEVEKAAELLEDDDIELFAKDTIQLIILGDLAPESWNSAGSPIEARDDDGEDEDDDGEDDDGEDDDGEDDAPIEVEAKEVTEEVQQEVVEEDTPPVEKVVEKVQKDTPPPVEDIPKKDPAPQEPEVKATKGGDIVITLSVTVRIPEGRSAEVSVV